MYAITVSLLILLSHVEAFWRLPCGRIQLGRLDPIVTPGGVSGHVHTISGPNNFGVSSTFQSLTDSCCTSCPVQSDKSAYWTPQLYYRYSNGTFSEVGNGGTIVYYLDRGDDLANMEPFPEGFSMVSGDPTLRAYNNSALTWNGKRPIADRVSFACINYQKPSPETNAIENTDCPQGLRAQVHFPTCWDGANTYKRDQSHVAHLDRIDNGHCPPTHPRRLPHLFYEVYYDVAKIQKEQGGYFVFSQGDPTGYGFHGDFQNGWNTQVLTEAIVQCMGPNAVNSGGSLEGCPPFAASLDGNVGTNCPQQSSMVNEKVTGLLSQLPGCNPVSFGPHRATQTVCQEQPSIVTSKNGTCVRRLPQPGDLLGDFAYIGCATSDSVPLSGTSTNDDQVTIESCSRSCRQTEYRYSGLTNGRQCLCGNHILNNLQSTGVCPSPGIACGGDVGTFCGGRDFVHIYNDTKASVTAKSVPKAGQTQLELASNACATYQGCFAEAEGRALQGGGFYNTTHMTNELCGQFCLNSGFPVYGTEYREQCYCGTSISTPRTPEPECNMVCRGDTTQFCGAGSRLSVWSITLPLSTTTRPATTSTSAINMPTVAGAVYLGCMSEVSGRALNADSNAGSSQTLQLCAQRAADRNYRYFGLEYSSECYIGDTLNPASISLPESKCNMPCSGNKQQICGGSGALSLFNNTMYTPRIPRSIQLSQDISFTYQGCFTDKGHPRTLAAFSINQNTNSVDACVQLCYSKGYSWAGVEYGSECYCNNEGTGLATLKSDGDCSKPCPGNIKQNCGAGFALQVYRLASSS